MSPVGLLEKDGKQTTLINAFKLNQPTSSDLDVENNVSIIDDIDGDYENDIEKGPVSKKCKIIVLNRSWKNS